MQMNNQIRIASRRGLGRVECGGFGLIELMVSIVISLVIIAALVALFLGTSRNNREMATANSMIENGRFAIQILESDVVHAGFWGTYVPQFDDVTTDGVPTDVPTVVPDPCRAYSVANWNAAYVTALLGTPVQAYDKAQVDAGDVCLPGVLDANGDGVPDMIAASDLLVVRHAQTCVPGEAGCEADANGQVYLQGSLCTDDALTYVFGQTGTASFNLRRLGCATTAQKRKFVSNLYFVRDVGGLPTLMRSTFTLGAGGIPAHQAPVALVEGIDGFRVEFGVDDVSGTGGAVNYAVATAWVDDDTKEMPTNRGDGIPDGNFIRCDTATPCGTDELMNVTAVRIYVLARSNEATRGYTDTKTYALGAGTLLGPFNDGFKRHVYTTTVRLPNVSGRRERP
jgi:type IV pilus assembly protein PilW